MNVFRNAAKVRVMSLLLIVCMVTGLMIPVPESRAEANSANEKKLVYEGSGCRVELKESSSWDSGYVAEAVVMNTGKEELRNWTVEAVIKKGEIGETWNAGNKKSQSDGEEVVFEPESYNMILKSGEKTSFGFKVTGGTYRDIVSVKLVSGKSKKEDGATVTWKETGSWDGHKILEGTITNHSKKTIRDWSFSFEMEGTITNIWNGVLVNEPDRDFCVKSCSYNSVLEVGQSATFGFEVSYDTEVFGGVHNVRIYAGTSEKLEQEEPQKTPGNTPEPVKPTFTTVTTKEPVETEIPQPVVTPTETEEPGGDDISEDDIEFIQVENRDWNMDMIRANDPEVQKAKEKTDRKIRVTMLDSGINYSKEVDVVMRQNFVEGQDEMSCLFEDGSGHGTAIAEVLASNPKADSENKTDGVWIDDEYGEYTYYGETQADDDEDSEDETPETVDAEDSGLVSMGDLLDSGYDWTEGVNPNIELYSGKILDEENETTVDRVVEGIEWAIENETDILSLSIGMEKDSEKLHQAIKKAAANGMLIVAAVGDDEHVDYPAAYPEVMAVGMTDSMGQTDGIHSEVAAPGDFIVSRGPFDSMQVFSGSSMAVPHVVGLASILWQKDTTKGAEFIRGLIDVSANVVEGDESCEYGLIDCRYALDAYEEFEKQVEQNRSLLKHISRDDEPDEIKEEVSDSIENETEVVTEEEIEKVHGNWDKADHQAFVSKKYEGEWTNGEKYVKVLKSGLYFVDDINNGGCYGMHDHPWLHGFYGEETPCNYMTSFRSLVELADHMRENGTIKKINIKEEYADEVKAALDGIQKTFQKGKIGDKKWAEINSYCAKNGESVPKDCRSLLIYGMALHTLGDTFSHSSYGMVKKKAKKGKIVWKRYTHEKKGKWYADTITNRKLRYDSAKNATEMAIRKIYVDKDKGLASYENRGKEINAFCPTTQFKKLKNMSIQLIGKMSKKQKVPMMEYVEEGYVLEGFSKYYNQEVEISKKKSKQLEKYEQYVDKEKVEDWIRECFLIQVAFSPKMGELKQGISVQVKLNEEVILSQKPAGDTLAFLLSKEGEYTVEGFGVNGVFTICSIKDGVVYDSIGRTMEKCEPEGEEELDEGEDMELCDLEKYRLSTDCLVKGKVVQFDYRSGGVFLEDMPALDGADIRFKSKDSGKVYETKTKKDGSYQIQVPAGKYDITYEKGNNYIVMKQLIEIPENIDLYSNITVEMIDTDWDDEGYMIGTLYDQKTGKPISGARIQIYKGIGYYDKDPVQTVTTDGNGDFCTDFLNAGAYTFVIRKDGYETMHCYQNIIGYIEKSVPAIKMERKE
ncbi:MAG: cellulose binding domain-containing protein [Roseburia sp.]|nr:cellulose binding domain-containing protein [Roseburia sp.]